MRLLQLLLSIILIASFLAGCGGGGGAGPVEQPSITMTVGADTAVTDFSGARADIVPAAPLSPGSAVIVYDFSNGRVIGTGNLGPDGMCRIGVTPGMTIAVVVTGMKAGKNYRLSTIIPMVPVDGGRFVATPITSMAAEAIALKHFGKTPLDDETFDKVLQEARSFARVHLEADYAVGAGLICSESFGQPGCIDTSMLRDVVDAVPDVIDSSVITAKNAVQQMKDAGVSLSSLLKQEKPDIESVFAAATATKYRWLADRLFTLMMPAMFGGMEYADSEGNPIWPTVFDLQIGKGYLVQRVEEGSDGWSNSYLKLSDYPQADTPGQITLIYPTAPGVIPGGTYALAAKQNGTTWTMTQTFSSDGAENYVITIPSPGSDPGENPSFDVGISLKDSQIQTPVTFGGTLSAKGPDRDSYTTIVFDGHLSSAEVTASGKFQADFPSSIPVGADPDRSTIYDFPTAFSMTNADIKVTDGATTISVTGNLSASMTILNGSKGPKSTPKHVEINGTYGNSHTGFKFDGSIIADWANPPSDLPNAKGTFHAVGNVACQGCPGYSADLRISLDGANSTADISLKSGSIFLTGTGNGTFGADGRLSSATLVLANQNNVVLSMAVDPSGGITGAVKVKGTSVADISRDGQLLRITYHTIPATFDEFVIGSW